MVESNRSIFAAADEIDLYKKGRTASRWLSSGSFLPAFIFVLLAVLSSTVIGYLKVKALMNWSYTSDLFSYDTVLQETLRGHIGLEFTYCNAFGDHAYLFLILLALLKLLLSTKMVYLLVLLGPISYLISSLIFFLSAKQIVHAWKAFLISAVFLFGFGQTYFGLFDYVYGMHPDTFAGYLAVAMVALLVWKEANEAQGKKSKLQTVGAVIFLLAFLALKEEMAILGILFFFVVFLFRRTAFHRNMALLSGVIFVIDLIVIALAKTPFNRTNNLLISEFIKNFQAIGFNYFFNNPQVNPKDQESFWLAIALGCVLFCVAAVVSKRINPYSLGLLLVGLVKMLFGLAIQDFSLVTWHNFAGLTMILAACLIQFLFVVKIKSIYPLFGLILLCILSGYSYLSSDISFTRNQLDVDSTRQSEMSGYYKELSQFMKQIDSTQVVSIPQYTVKGWVGYSYAFFPRGVFAEPVGVADFVVFPVGKAIPLAGGYSTQTLPPDLLKSFSVVDQTPHFILLKRKSLSESEAISREACLSSWK